MYTSFNRDQIVSNPGNTKYTEYLKSLPGEKDTNFYNDGGGPNGLKARQSHPLLPISANEVKFSNIFSARESNALKLQLLQKTSSLPLLDRDNNNNSNSALLRGVSSETSRVISRRRSTGSGTVHGSNHQATNLVSRKGDSVANILYSTLRHGQEYDNPSADETLHTGSDSKVDYDPHEPLPPVDQIALRHELLNNIRAISRATYFEDLYTGKVRRNSGSPEAEIIRLLENPQEAIAIKSTSNEANTIPSKDASLSRVDRWVKESSGASTHSHNNETDDDVKEEVISKQDQSSSLYHQSVWNEDQQRKKNNPVRAKTKTRKKETKNETTDGSLTESDVETASAYMARTNQYKNTKFAGQNKPLDNSISSSQNTLPKPFSRNSDSIVARSMGNFLPPHSGIIESTSHYLQSKYLSPSLSTDPNDMLGKKLPFSFGYNGLDDGIPLSVSLPNVAQKQYNSTPVALHGFSSNKNNSFSRPENLNHSSSYATSKASFGMIKKRESNNGEQVRRRMAPQQFDTSPPRRMDMLPNRGGAKLKPDHKVPGIYTRLNMNQWEVKKVCFYVNGDEFYPKFEYRFRHGKDIRDLDQLLDLLTKRFPILPTGARYIFTMDGYPINSLEEIENDTSYVVSSTRKFKTLKYGSESSEGDSYGGVIPGAKRNKNNGKLVPREHQPLSRLLSASDGNLNQEGRGGVGGLRIQKSMTSLNSNSVSDVPKVVAHVIQKASNGSMNMTTTSSPMTRQPIRLINGSKPSMQSQVLLNTKTSQPFEDLVRDLGMSVKIPTQPIGNRLETLAGRPIQSYSQLRSELLAGQRAFYIYSDQQSTDNGKLSVSDPNPTRVPHKITKNSKPIVKAMLGQVNSNSSTDISISTNQDIRGRRNHRRSHTPIPSSRSPSRITQTPSYAHRENWK